jgi:hypothetical protein
MSCNIGEYLRCRKAHARERGGPSAREGKWVICERPASAHTTRMRVQVRFKTWGSLNAARDNVLVVCHALTGNSSLDQWWGGLLGTCLPTALKRQDVCTRRPRKGVRHGQVLGCVRECVGLMLREHRTYLRRPAGMHAEKLSFDSLLQPDEHCIRRDFSRDNDTRYSRGAYAYAEGVVVQYTCDWIPDNA